MEVIIKENSKMAKLQATVSEFGLMALSTEAIGHLARKTEKEYTLGLMEKATKVTGS